MAMRRPRDDKAFATLTWAKALLTDDHHPSDRGLQWSVIRSSDIPAPYETYLSTISLGVAIRTAVVLIRNERRRAEPPCSRNMSLDIRGRPAAGLHCRDRLSEEGPCHADEVMHTPFRAGDDRLLSAVAGQSSERPAHPMRKSAARRFSSRTSWMRE